MRYEGPVIKAIASGRKAKDAAVEIARVAGAVASAYPVRGEPGRFEIKAKFNTGRMLEDAKACGMVKTEWALMATGVKSNGFDILSMGE